MQHLPSLRIQPATTEQHTEILRLLASPRYNAAHRAIYGCRLPGLDWAGAASLIHCLAGLYRTRPAVLDYPALGTCPEGLQERRAYAAAVQLTRTEPLDSGGRFRRSQPGEPVHLCYYTN